MEGVSKRLQPPDQVARRKRLQELVDHPEFAGKHVRLGRALGYTSGHYIGQLLRGERPITELLIDQLHSLHGGKFSGWFAPAHNPLPGFVEAHAASLVASETPLLVEWGDLMSVQLGSEFQTVMPDNSMAPEVPRGARILFVTGIEPEPGDFVLVADGDGNHYLREYRQVRPGHWQAWAINPAFLPLDSQADKLKVVAVFDGMRMRRSHRHT